MASISHLYGYFFHQLHQFILHNVWGNNRNKRWHQICCTFFKNVQPANNVTYTFVYTIQDSREPWKTCSTCFGHCSIPLYRYRIHCKHTMHTFSIKRTALNFSPYSTFLSLIANYAVTLESHRLWLEVPNNVLELSKNPMCVWVQTIAYIVFAQKSRHCFSQNVFGKCLCYAMLFM